jgi:hypothetical protein
VLYLLRGAPVVYYGDEVGMSGSGGDKAARQDMFPTKVTNWQQEPRVGAKPIGRGSSLTAAAEQLPMAKHIRALNGLRAKYAALRDGALIMRKADAQMLAWSRVDPSERREYVVGANAANKPATMTIVTASPDATFVAVFGGKSTVRTSTSGILKFTVPARATVVLRASRVLPGVASAPALVTTAAFDLDFGAPLLTATGYLGPDPLTVTFIGRTCANCAWTALGSDDSAPYRLVIEERAWAGGDYLDVAAISRTSDGKTAAGPILHISHADVSR